MGGDSVWYCAVATLPCTSTVGGGPGPPVQTPIPQDARMLLVTGLGTGGCVKGVGALNTSMGGLYLCLSAGANDRHRRSHHMGILEVL